MKRFFVDKLDNMRDIGGYMIGDTLAVKEGKILRSNCPTNLDNHDLQQLIDMKFTTVIDLRSDDEVKKVNGVFLHNPNFKYHHVNINGNGRIPDSRDEVLDSYIEILDGKKQIKEVFEILSLSEGGVIYYCTAGKDRTGVVTACILKSLGVCDMDIVEDYLLSGVFLSNTLEKYANSVTDKDMLPIITPHADTILGLLKYIDNTYGPIDDYLHSCNITDDTLNGIKRKYTNVVTIRR